MRRITALWIVLTVTALLLSACSASAEELTGEAEGYGGVLRVAVTMEGGVIRSVRVTEHHETEGVGTRAIEALPDAIAQAGSTEVDDVSGATVTSNAIKAAVTQAIGSNDAPQPDAMYDSTPRAEERSGIGMCATGRIGPGTTEDGSPIYSINVAMAGASFDEDGRITSLALDQLEVLSGGKDGETPLFRGFPTQSDGEDAFLKEISAWTTKGMRGDGYALTSGSWHRQADAYEQLFLGKTVDEVETWFKTYCSDETGKPLRASDSSEADQAKYAALSAREQELLADVTTSATMSLRDIHGDLLTAIRRAWEDAST